MQMEAVLLEHKGMKIVEGNYLDLVEVLDVVGSPRFEYPDARTVRLFWLSELHGIECTVSYEFECVGSQVSVPFRMEFSTLLELHRLIMVHSYLYYERPLLTVVHDFEFDQLLRECQDLPWGVDEDYPETTLSEEVLQALGG